MARRPVGDYGKKGAIRMLRNVRPAVTMSPVMSYEDVVAISDPVERAALADKLMWADHPRRLELRTVRGIALRAALDSGVPADAIAGRLVVTVADLTWMAAPASPAAA